MKKKRDNVKRDNIRDSWIKKTGKSGVVAYLLHF